MATDRVGPFQFHFIDQLAELERTRRVVWLSSAMKLAGHRRHRDPTRRRTVPHVNAQRAASGPTRFRVLIEAEAGSNVRRIYDETTLELLSSREVAADYPFPYGFILGTMTDDGGAIDCYLITGEAMAAGTVAEVGVVGLLEQFEGEEVDHKVLAVMPDSPRMLDPGVRDTLEAFIRELFRAHPRVKVRVGRLLGPEEATAFVDSHRSR